MNRASLSFAISSLVLAGSGSVRAQTASPAEPTVEKIESHFVIAPDFKFTRVDGEFGGLAGVYGGRLLDVRLLVGGGLYWLANGSEARKMTYGGALVEYLARPTQRIHFSLRGLVGVGTSTLGFELPNRSAPRGGPGSFGRFSDRHGRGAPERVLLFSDGFVVAEPQANVYFNLARWLRLGLGASYRFTGASELGDRLAGASGNFSVVLGSF